MTNEGLEKLIAKRSITDIEFEKLPLSARLLRRSVISRRTITLEFPKAVQVPSVSKILRGRQNYSAISLSRIARAVGCDIGWLAKWIAIEKGREDCSSTPPPKEPEG